MEKPRGHESLHKEHFQLHAISLLEMLSVAGVRYHTKLLSVKTAAGPKLALAMILLAWGAADLTLSKMLAKCLGCWYDG